MLTPEEYSKNNKETLDDMSKGRSEYLYRMMREYAKHTEKKDWAYYVRNFILDTMGTLVSLTILFILLQHC